MFSYSRSGQTGVLMSVVLGLSACTTNITGYDDDAASFSITRVNPPTMVDPTAFGYTQIVTVNNGKIVYLAGQGPTMRNAKSPAPEDLRGQARNAVDNILLALESMGAGPENIVYLRINLVDYNPRMLMDISPELQRLTAPGGKPPASVLVGVESLVIPSTRIEIETVVAIP